MSFSLLANKTCTDGVNVFNCTCLPSISIDLSVLNHSKFIKYYVLVFRFLNQSVNITVFQAYLSHHWKSRFLYVKGY